MAAIGGNDPIITPAMIQAGVDALYEANDDLLRWTSSFWVEDLAVRAYEAMERARLEGLRPAETCSETAPSDHSPMADRLADLSSTGVVESGPEFVRVSYPPELRLNLYEVDPHGRMTETTRIELQRYAAQLELFRQSQAESKQFDPHCSDPTPKS